MDGSRGISGMIYYHGTSSINAARIIANHFNPTSYFTTSLEDAEYYAAIGGEWDLQKREEEWELVHGHKPREYFGPDLWDMYEELYPVGSYPVIIKVEISEDILKKGKKDSGATNSLVFETVILATSIVSIEKVFGEETTEVKMNLLSEFLSKKKVNKK
jgi:hypothetical protein